MKKIYFLVALVATNFAKAQTADFENLVIGGAESYWDGSDMTGSSNGSGLFDSIIEDGMLGFSNQYDTTWGSAWGYWSNGWAFTNQTSDQLTDFAGTYSSYAGGASSGSNYIVGQNGSEITLPVGELRVFTSIMVTNNNYAGHSMLNGDAFAKQFGSPNDASGTPDGTNGEDWFLLNIKGYDAAGTVTDSVLFYLADYRFADNAQDYIVKNWTSVSLSSLGEVNKLSFHLSSSDVGQFGMNTPAFFAVDAVNYGFLGLNAKAELNISLYPNPASDFVTISGMDENANLEVYNLNGKLMLSKKLTSQKQSIDITALSSGMYYFQISSESNLITHKVVKP